MIKVITILGARPQFIKAGNVSREIAKYYEIEEVIVHTGQHFDENMSDVFFEQMHIPLPKYNLNINGLSHGAMTGQMLQKIEEVLLKERPDWVLVYGDTNSTLSGALAASKLHIKIAHIEAGLRSFNMKMPEEVNRILTDRISALLFCPTQSAVENLNNEGYDNFNTMVVKTGDVMQDGAMFYVDLSQKPKSLASKKNFVLVTIHRAENTDNEVKLKEIFESLSEIAQDIEVILPLHPKTKKNIATLDICLDNLTIIEPVGYLEMVWLIKNASMIMTDSGGLQKEAFFFGKPCLTLRDETEWVELIENNFNVLVGTDRKKILKTYKEHGFNLDYDIDLYGKGKASEKIVKTLLEYQEL